MKKDKQGVVGKSMIAGCLLAFCSSSIAEPSNVPLLGGVADLTQIVKREVTDGLVFTSSLARDTTLFTIAGLTLDAYVLTLPLEAGVKARVIGQISNPLYAVPLAHFLHTFKTRYSTEGAIPLFQQHIKAHYQRDDFPGMKHELFKWEDPKQTADKEKQSSNALDRDLIATFVTLYDALYSNDNFILNDDVADAYQYLGNNEKDAKLIKRIQPLVVSVLTRLLVKLEPGDIKDAVSAIIADDAAHATKLNNKAEAVTITLIDFIRLNIQKNYRQYELEVERTKSFERWMVSTFSDNAEMLTNYLQQQNQRKYAVQITVDGLQGEYLKSLASQSVNSRKDPFIERIIEDSENKQAYRPQNISTQIPKHKPQHNYLKYLNDSRKASSIEDPAYLPFFKWLYANFESSITEGGISSSPTISVRNLPLIWTGAAVAGEKATGVPNFHFIDRQDDRAYYFFGNDALQLDPLLAQKNTQTMFDRLNYLKTLNCNAQYDWNAHVSFDGLVNLALGEGSRDFGEQRCLRELEYRAGIEQQLRKDRKTLIAEIQNYKSLSLWSPIALLSKKWLIQRLIKDLAIKSEKGMPDYVLIYNPWPDHFAHFYGPFSDEIVSPTGELNRLDYWLGQLKSVYQYAGIEDKTLWGMAGDHGLSPVYYYLNPEEQVLKALSKELKREIIIKKISSDEGEGPKITNAINYPSNKGIDVIVASTAGGNYMMDFFHSTDMRWQEQPLYSDLVHWRPASLDKDQSINIINEIAQRLESTLDYLVVREKKCSLAECDIRLIAYREGKRIDEIIRRKDNQIWYSAVNNTQPVLLRLNESNPYRKALDDNDMQLKNQLLNRCLSTPTADDVTTWCSEKQWRELAFYTPKPDSVNQMAHLYDEDRAGTVNLFPLPGIGFNTKVPGRHAGESFLEKDAFIGFWGKPITNKSQLRNIENGSLAPTLFEYLTGETVVVDKNGWGFPSVLNELLSKPD